MAIVGILSSISVGVFTSYRQKSYDTHALHALYNVRSAQELHYTDTGTYTNCDSTNCTSILPGIESFHDSVQLETVSDTSSDEDAFNIFSCSNRGTEADLTFELSTPGGPISITLDGYKLFSFATSNGRISAGTFISSNCSISGLPT